MAPLATAPLRAGLTRIQDALAAPRAWLVITGAIHLAALVVLYETEWGLFHGTLAVLGYAFLNFVWLIILRRPASSAALSLIMIVLLIVVSRFKFDILWMTITFFDLLIIDSDTFAFLLNVFPQLRGYILAGLILGVPLLIVLWRGDAFRVRRWIAAAGAALCVLLLAVLSFSEPEQGWEPFQGVNHVSNFARSGITQGAELMSHGWFDSARAAPDRFALGAQASCRPARKPPNIILLLDESSFDISVAPGVKVAEGYKEHFQSFDGKARKLVVEATGGPTWYAEYNVLTGLSARSFGRFMFYVTRIAAGRVERGLPHALRRCGYRTETLYPTYGAFLGARRFQSTTGIERFVDQDEMGAPDDMQPDSYYFEHAVRAVERNQGASPLFLFVYVTANHFPWTDVFRPELTPGWQSAGNADASVNEYIRRQMMSAHDYHAFLARLRSEFPDQQFLIVRFGDHQPAISSKILEPGLDNTAIGRRIMAFDPKYFTTYYAIEGVNFTPADVSSALPTLDAPYLPIVIQEAAGLPLDPSFAEQKRILERCKGLFYACAGGTEARRFNRLLIEAGLIKGL
jgi:phosphoglycerol transferase MdoB-like AlkP superfamily enzyme